MNLQNLDFTPLWITMKTGVAATFVSFFLGIFAAEAVLFGVCLWYPKDRLPLYSMIVTGVLMALYMILLIAHRRHASLTIKGIKVLPK